jgi:hypothetical protein
MLRKSRAMMEIHRMVMGAHPLVSQRQAISATVNQASAKVPPSIKDIHDFRMWERKARGHRNL